VLEPLLSLPMAKTHQMVLQLQVINKALVLFNSHLSATNLALKSQTNTKLLLVVFNNSKSMATTTFNILVTLLHHTELQICTTNVITPSSPPSCRMKLTLCSDNGPPAPKYEQQ
jgi:hypothetical protein